MDNSKFEKEIQEKLQNREIQPSASAWERLSHQLDKQEKKKKKGWFLYIGYAASIAVIISLVFLLKGNGTNITVAPENTIVTKDVKTPEIDKKNFKEVKTDDGAIVKNETLKEVEEKQPVLKKKTFKKQIPATRDESVIAKKTTPKEVIIPKKKIDIKTVVKEDIVVAENKPLTKKLKKDPEFKKPEGVISVNSDALLYAVTHSKEELRGYYKKYKISRAKVLRTIEKELKKSNLTIDPTIILAEVERDVNEESFQNNFYRLIKKRVSDVATAIANRNN
ncbi:MAG: hypothetical protein JXR05_11630 [Flavobacteriaceae bacterium]